MNVEQRNGSAEGKFYNLFMLHMVSGSNSLKRININTWTILSVAPFSLFSAVVVDE